MVRAIWFLKVCCQFLALQTFVLWQPPPQTMTLTLLMIYPMTDKRQWCGLVCKGIIQWCIHKSSSKLQVLNAIIPIIGEYVIPQLLAKYGLAANGAVPRLRQDGGAPAHQANTTSIPIILLALAMDWPPRSPTFTPYTIFYEDTLKIGLQNSSSQHCSIFNFGNGSEMRLHV